ncbi:MAG: RNA methyltransferase [Bacteroides sp.]|nr:RNA methyltransferase [Bacteroides sp.]
MELTNKIRKETKELAERKHRKRTGLFKCEGSKCVLDIFNNFELKYLFATDDWIQSHADVAKRAGEKLLICRRADIVEISSLSTPADVIAVFHTPETILDLDSLRGKLTLALDGVQDPGNVGTIIRLADWFGVENVLCSLNTADVFSPKALQSTMGAISKVKVHYCDLPETLGSLASTENLFGTFLNGESIYASQLPSSGVIIMGNEGNGISVNVASLVTHRLLIPSFANGNQSSESLNVATATAITLSEFRRQNM